MPFRHLRVRKFEELDDLVRHSRKRFYRLVNCLAAVWKTAIITKWTAIAVVVSVIGLGAIMSWRTWQRRKELKAKYAAKYAAMIAARAEALAGVHPRAAELGGARTRGTEGKSRGK